MELGYTQHDNTLRPITNDWRFHHTHVIGKTGTGKSTAVKRWILDDIARGDGVAYFDPHGDDTEDLLRLIPAHRRGDVVLFNPADRDFPLGLNILHNVPREHRPRVANAVLDMVKTIWAYQIATPQLDMYFLTTVSALLETPDATLMGINTMLTSERYRARVLSRVKDPVLRTFWDDFFERIPDREQRQGAMSTLNKIFGLIVDPTVRNIVGQVKSSLDLRDIMANRKILLVCLPQGELGIEKSTLLGLLVLTQLHVAALSRGTERPPFHIFLDEAHRFGSGTLIEMLSGIRKFNVSITLSHQYLAQLSDTLREAVLGTAGTLVSFRLGTSDARVLTDEFQLTRNDHELTELHAFTAHARTLDRTYPGLVMPALDYPEEPPSSGFSSAVSEVQTRSRRSYATQRKHVEERIARFISSA